MTLPVFFAMEDPFLKKRISQVTEETPAEEIAVLVEEVKRRKTGRRCSNSLLKESCRNTGFFAASA